MIASYFNCVQAKGKHGNRMATWTAFGRMGQNLARLTKLPVKGRTSVSLEKSCPQFSRQDLQHFTWL